MGSNHWALVLGSGLSLPRLGLGPVLGTKVAGHGTSVYRDSPVDVVKARNCNPAGDSESKSMISRWKSSRLAPVAARLKAKVAGGGGFVIGSKPRFLSTHLRDAIPQATSANLTRGALVWRRR